MADPVGVMELAERIDASRKTIWTWRDSGNMPPPEYASVNSSPAWEYRKVLRFLGDVGRLHSDSGRAEYQRLFKKEPRAAWLGGKTPPDIAKKLAKLRAT